jgi:hypothetical protein
VEPGDYRVLESGNAKLLLGRAKLTSKITWDSADFSFGVLHLGYHTINCGVRSHYDENSYGALIEEVEEPFKRADFAETLRLLDKHFGSARYSLGTIFRDEQRKIVDLILEPTLKEAEAYHRQIYEKTASMMRFLKHLNIPPPKALYTSAELVLNAGLREAFEEEAFDVNLVSNLLEESKLMGISLDADTLEFALRKSLERMAEKFLAAPDDLNLLQRLEGALQLVQKLPFHAHLRRIQNAFNDIWQSEFDAQRLKAEKGDETAIQWVHYFSRLGQLLSFRIGVE